jgi:hypothetical protein
MTVPAVPSDEAIRDTCIELIRKGKDATELATQYLCWRNRCEHVEQREAARIAAAWMNGDRGYIQPSREKVHCRDCIHDPGKDRLCLVGHRHATNARRHCQHYQLNLSQFVWHALQQAGLAEQVAELECLPDQKIGVRIHTEAKHYQSAIWQCISQAVSQAEQKMLIRNLS